MSPACAHTRRPAQTRTPAHLQGGPAQRRVLGPVLAVVRELGVLAVVAALGVLQVQDRGALDREGRPLRGGGRRLLAQLRPGRLDGPLGWHWGLGAGRGLGLPLALVACGWPALRGRRAGVGAEPGRGAEEGRGRRHRLAGPLAALSLLGFGEHDAGRHGRGVRAGWGFLPQHFGGFLLFPGNQLREGTHRPVQRVLKHLGLGQLGVLRGQRFRCVLPRVAGPEFGKGGETQAENECLVPVAFSGGS